MRAEPRPGPGQVRQLQTKVKMSTGNEDSFSSAFKVFTSVSVTATMSLTQVQDSAAQRGALHTTGPV